MLFRFAHPLVLLLLLLVPAMVVWYLRVERRKKGALRFSALSLVSGIGDSYRLHFRNAPVVLRILAVALAVLALARPQSGVSREEIESHGVDIMVLLDVSTSMKAEDFKPDNRLAVSKKTVEKFVNSRKNDRIGVVAYAANAFTLCPLTLDHDLVVTSLKGAGFAAPEEDGTAIGNAIATAVNRLRDSKAKSRVVVLSTDGANNRGEIDPVTAAKAAAAFKIKIYTIGVGKEGPVPYPVDHPLFGRIYQNVQSDLDEPTLQSIASETGGRFFRARDPKALEAIYGQIDKLEKSEIKSHIYTEYSELFQWFLGLAVLLLALEIGLSNTLLRRIP